MLRWLARSAVLAPLVVIVILVARGLSDHALVTVASIVAAAGVVCGVSLALLGWRAHR